jgi:hypothetical protein
MTTSPSASFFSAPFPLLFPLAAGTGVGGFELVVDLDFDFGLGFETSLPDL